MYSDKKTWALESALLAALPLSMVLVVFIAR